MPAPEVADEFLELLIKSQLVRKSQISDALSRAGIDDSEPEIAPPEIARALIKDGLITRYQAEQLLQGSPRGLVFDGFRILEILGFGGMGMVYIAEEIKTKWQVAIKVLADKYRNDSAVYSRFQLEAEAGMKLDHPNIVRTRGIYKAEDIYGPIHYVVMDLVKGVSLIELLLLQGPLEWRQACDVICQAANGLHFAHEAGMIHRDVKPDNVLIRSNGTVKILDFGLAMLDDNDEEFTMAMIHGQDCLGTADYVAPEQTFDSYQIDARADIYSLGCTFYAALTAKLPFPSKNMADKLKGHRKLRPKPIREIRNDVPERVELIVQKMMAKRPENRFSSAAELCRYIEPLSKRKPVEFDFRTILKWRARQSKKRAERKDREARDSVPTSTMSAMDASASTAKSRYFNPDEITGQDTQMERSGRDDAPDHPAL